MFLLWLIVIFRLTLVVGWNNAEIGVFQPPRRAPSVLVSSHCVLARDSCENGLPVFILGGSVVPLNSSFLPPLNERKSFAGRLSSHSLVSRLLNEDEGKVCIEGNTFIPLDDTVEGGELAHRQKLSSALGMQQFNFTMDFQHVPHRPNSLKHGSSDAISSLHESVLANVVGPTCFQQAGDGAIYFISICAVALNFPFHLQADVIMVKGKGSEVFVPVWHRKTSQISSNASCLVTLVPLTSPGGQRSGRKKFAWREKIVIAGGIRYGNMHVQESVVIDLFDLVSLKMSYNVANFPIHISPCFDEDFQEEDTIPAEEPCVTYLANPLVTDTSTMFFVLGAGFFTQRCESQFISMPSRGVFGVSITEVVAASKEVTWVVEYSALSCLPESIRLPGTDFFAAALTAFGTGLHFATVNFGAHGAVGSLNLATNRNPNRFPEWETALLGDSEYTLQHSTFFFFPIFTNGVALGVLAFGGEDPFTRSLSGAVTGNVVSTKVLPTLISVPYKSTAFTTFKSDKEKTATFVVPITNGQEGKMGLSPTSTCKLLLTSVPYNGSQFLELRVNFSTFSQYMMAPLFLCYSDGNEVLWATTSGRLEKVMMFTVINTFQPILAGFQPSHDDALTKFQLYAIVGLGTAIIVALIVILLVGIRQLRRRKKEQAASEDGEENEKTKLLSSDTPARFKNLKISTNSHSSRYQIMNALSPSIKDKTFGVPVTESQAVTLSKQGQPATYLVRRIQDKTLMAMKYVCCGDDIDRLTSIREFEVLQLLQGHPQVIVLVDMFMSYTFDDQQSHTTTSLVRIAAPINTSDNFTRSSEAGVIPGLHGPPLSIKEQRYIGLVMEFHPLGNVATWVEEYVKKNSAVVPEVIILSVAMQLFNLLKHMHTDFEPSLVCRGLKPENILVSGPPNASMTFLPVVVSDFGFSKLAHFTPPCQELLLEREKERRLSTTHSEPLISASSREEIEEGTSCFSVPICYDEAHAISKAMDEFVPSSDLWCVGCVMFAMTQNKFGDQFPFIGSVLNTARKSSYEERVCSEIKADVRVKGYSPELSALIMQLLNRDPSVRHSAEQCLMMFRKVGDTLKLQVNSLERKR